MIDILAGRCTIHGMLTKTELRGGFCFACEEDGLDEHDFDEDDELCEDHDWIYDRHTQRHYCRHCDLERPADWYVEE